MEMKTVKLGDLYAVSNGLSKGKAFFGHGYPFLTFSEVMNNFFVPDILQSLVQTETKERAKFSIQRGDVFLNRTSETADELGISCVALKDYPNATFNGFCKRLRPISEDVVPEYIGYYLRTNAFRKHMSSLTGSMITRASLRNEQLLSIEIDLPAKENQLKIAHILRQYDILIDNCKKQIALLEEAAQRLYREWFSDFSPNSVLSELAEDVGKSVNKSNRTIYKCYTPIDCLPKKSLTYIATKDISFAESSLKSYKPKDILFGAMRVYFHKVCIAQENGLTRSTCIVLNAIKEEYWAYLALLMFRDETIAWATANSKEGTTIPYISWEKLKYMPIYLPDEEVAKQFNVIVEPYLSNIIVLAKYIRNLAEIKNILLSRLISGQIEINV